MSYNTNAVKVLKKTLFTINFPAFYTQLHHVFFFLYILRWLINIEITSSCFHTCFPHSLENAYANGKIKFYSIPFPIIFYF